MIGAFVHSSLRESRLGRVFRGDDLLSKDSRILGYPEESGRLALTLEVNTHEVQPVDDGA